MVEYVLDEATATFRAFFSGRLDATASEGMAKDLEQRLQAFSGHCGSSGPGVIFDLGQVSYVSSAFLRICVSTAKQAGVGHFSVENSSPDVKRIFKIAGLDETLKVL